MTEAERLAQRVEVVVKPFNNYGGDAPAGTRLTMTRAEYELNRRCLQEVSGPPEPGPRTARVSIPAHAARTLGFPLGRRQEGPLVYEVTRLPPDGKAPLPSRQELEARAADPVVARAQIKVLDLPEVKEALGRARAEVERAHEQLAKESGYLRRQEQTSEKLRADLAEAQEMNARLRNDLSVKDKGFGEVVLQRDAAAEEVAKLKQALQVAHQDVEAARADATKLTAELAAPKTPAPAQEQAAPPAKGKAKE